NGLPEGENLLEGDRWWMILLGILAVGLVGLGYSALAWRMTSYAVDDESVHLRTGVLVRQQRRARLDRLQAVDVLQPLLARLLGARVAHDELRGRRRVRPPAHRRAVPSAAPGAARPAAGGRRRAAAPRALLRPRGAQARGGRGRGLRREARLPQGGRGEPPA